MRFIYTVILLLIFSVSWAQENNALSFTILEYGNRVSGLSTEKAAIDIIVPVDGVRVQNQNLEYLSQELYNGCFKRVYVADDRDAELTVSVPGYPDLYLSVPAQMLTKARVCKILVQMQNMTAIQLKSSDLQQKSSSISFQLNDTEYNYCEIDVKTSMDLLYITNDLPAISQSRTESGVQKFLVRIPRDGTSRYILFYVPGYYPCKEIVVNSRNFRPNTTYQMDVRIPKDLVTITVDKEDFTNLWVDGVNCGLVSSVQVEKGMQHIVYTEYNGHTSRKRMETINASRSYTLKLNMGSLSIKTNAKGYQSEVSYGKEKYILTGPAVQERLVGNYTVVLSSPGFVSREFPVTIPHKGKLDVVRKCHLYRQVDNVRFAGVASSLKLNYGAQVGYLEDNRWGIIADLRFSPLFFDSSIRMKNVRSTRILSERQYLKSDNPGWKGLTVNVGPAFRFHEKAAMYIAMGYGQYSNIYEYQTRYYSPAKCRALNIEVGAMLVLRNLYYNRWWNNILPTVSFSRVMSKPAFADINFGLCYCF